MDSWQETATIVDVMTTAEVAKAGDVSQAYVRQLIQDGRLQAVKVSGRWLVERGSVVRWLRTRRGRGRPPEGTRPKGGEQLELLE